MAFSFHVNLDSLGLNLGNVNASGLVRADLIVRGREEGHGHGLDLGDVDEGHLSLTVEPVRGELLEAVRQAVHDPVLLGLDRLTLSRVSTVVLAENS